jgi:DNA-directed RNA polymerase specialized sigma24 family protein
LKEDVHSIRGEKPMDDTTSEDPPPESTDLPGWRQVIADGCLRHFRPEAIVAAIQDLGPHTDKTVLNPLAKHLSDRMFFMLRRLVGRNHPNHGQDIIERVHIQLWEALLQPTSADGKALRVAFGSRLKFRLKDALAIEARSFRTPTEDPKGGAILSLAEHPDLAEVEASVDAIDERIDVDRILENVTDGNKRLAFRLFMDGVPYKSKKSNSIAEALGISERTAREWIKEAQELLQRKMGDKS